MGRDRICVAQLAPRIAFAILCGVALVLSVSPFADAFPWDIDMFRGPEVQPLAAAPRVSPADTMPVHGGEPPMNREQMAARLHNPLQPTSKNLEQGKQLFMNNCAPCHGANGDGHGSVAYFLSRAPSNLATGVSRNLPDGYIYGTIRDGGVVMPSYGDAMSIDERWQVVSFIRSLQHAAQAKK